MSRLLIIAAAGDGARLGRSEPKALVALRGRSLLARTLDALAPVFDRIIVAAPGDRRADCERIAARRAGVVAGGRTRTESVRHGFAALAATEDDVVAVHDAARPLVTAEEALSVVARAEQAGAAIAAVPIVDTVKRVEAGRIVATLDRSGLFAAATPQAFRARVLRRAFAADRDATDEAALCEELGIAVEVVPVSRRSFKITTPEDLALAEALLAAEEISSSEEKRR
jgi:2-C-methyl-D-erythritol 4-phosphate cytidylyltransferase